MQQAGPLAKRAARKSKEKIARQAAA